MIIVLIIHLMKIMIRFRTIHVDPVVIVTNIQDRIINAQIIIVDLVQITVIKFNDIVSRQEMIQDENTENRVVVDRHHLHRVHHHHRHRAHRHLQDHRLLHRQARRLDLI